jgi:hypothetical protein
MFEKDEKGLNPLTPTAALLNLLRKDTGEIGRSVNNPRVGINRQTLDKVSRQTSQDVVDSDSIMQLLPDLELVETVLVGSILSPKDLGETDLTFTSDPVLFDSEVARLLIEPIEEHFKRDYKINDRLDLILRDILFRKGAAVHIVLPENVLDKMVNGNRHVSMESLTSIQRDFGAGKPLGFLGHPEKTGISMESWNTTADQSNRIAKSPLLMVTDNFNVLKGPVFGKKIRDKFISAKLRTYQVGLEAQVTEDPKMHAFTPEDIERLYQRARGGNAEHTQVVSSPEFMERQSVGHPLPLLPPMEAVIPVFMQGRPQEHIGYFLLVDQNGYPVSKDSTRDFYGELQAGWKGGGGNDQNSEILRLTKEALGQGNTKGDYELDEVQKTYNSIIVNDLNNRLRNGAYDQEITVGMTEEIQRIMLFRSWKSKCTQLVFIPAELCIYMAFDYNENGIGETLLQRSKMIATMRSTLLMADTMGGMRNAVGRKKVSITLDPDDIDPEQTINNIQSMIMESAHRSFPLAAPDPAQAMDHLIRSGFDFAINTNGADYAETKVEYDDYNTNQQAGNPDLQDRLRRMHISSMGVHPEKVDPMSSPDFATTATQNDLVMSRRVRAKQKVFVEFLSKFVKVFTKHSSILRQKMAKILIRNKEMLNEEQKDLSIDELIDDFIEAIEVSLPAPDTTQHERQAETYEAYTRLLDTALEAYITPDMFPDEIMGVTGLADTIIANTKAYFKRQFLSSNNILPELNILLEMDGEKPAFSLLDFMGQAQETMGRAFLEFAKVQKDTKEKFAKDFKAVIEEAGGADSGGFGGGGDTGGDTGGDDGGFGGGGDDGFGGGDSGGGDDGFGGDDLGGDTGGDAGGDAGSDTGDGGFDDAAGTDANADEDAAGNTDGLDNPVDAAAKDEEDEEEEDPDKDKPQ